MELQTQTSPPSLLSKLARHPLLLIAILTAAVLLIHGYHPLADDGAVYVTGIKKLADPGLYLSDAIFALSPTRPSLFAHLLAALLRFGHIPLPALLLLCHLASIFFYLVGVWFVAGRIFPSVSARWGAVLLAACCFTLPVAGTSLCIMDPYVTARSFSTPISLFALAAALGERWTRSALWLVAAALLHPLMAIYAMLAVLTVSLTQRRRWQILGLLFTFGWACSGLLFALTQHPSPAAAYSLATLSRSYFFLSSWHWYEFPGLLTPLLLLGFAGCQARAPWPARALAIAVTLLGSAALLVSLCFVHRTGSLWLARVQPLRAFQWVYLAGVTLAGGMLGANLRQHKRAVMAIYITLALALFAGQRLTYASSNHVEWPGTLPRNPWQLAFLWIRGHTPQNAVFALDNDYIETPGEDGQGFRATSERSAVADYFKDGGIASNFREAAFPWLQGSQATLHLNAATDSERLARLQPLGVTWIVLPATSATQLLCPFDNGWVRVCRLTPLLHNAEGAK